MATVAAAVWDIRISCRFCKQVCIQSRLLVPTLRYYFNFVMKIKTVITIKEVVPGSNDQDHNINIIL